jgi:hypothetical protein
MGPDLTKMSDDELFKRLGLIDSRLSYAYNSSHCGRLVSQLQGMHEEVLFQIQERAERHNMKKRLDIMPDVVNIEEVKKTKRSDDSNSRAKSKSDIIGRLRRTTTPTTTKD